MKKLGILSLALLVSLPGCWRRKCVQAEKCSKPMRAKVQKDASVAESNIRSFFDDELGEFTNTQELLVGDGAQDFTADDFALVSDDEVGQAGFDVVYFDFDSYVLKADQEQKIEKIVARVKKEMKESAFFGTNNKPCISITGHSDDIYISQVYNLVLSENRAKVLKDRLVKEGVPAECIKIIGYGSAVPALVDGKPVTGDRAQQAPNRRDEVRILYS